MQSIASHKKHSFFAHPEKAFVTIGLVFGLLFLFITPPFQAPDEYNHFYRAFQISEGQVLAELQPGQQIGGMLPISLVTTAEKVSRNIPYHPEVKQKPSDILALLNLRLRRRKRVFIAFPNTAVYSPVPYLPQATGIWLGRTIALSPIKLLYMGRIFNLLVWVLLGYLAIKLNPIFKWPFFLLLLIPTSLSQAASLSADGFTNGVSFLLIAIFLRYAFGEVPAGFSLKSQSNLNSSKALNKRDIFILLLLSVSLALSKQVYLPMLFMYFLVPKARVGSIKKYLMIFALMFSLSLLASGAWTFLTKERYNPFPFPPNASASKQLLFIIENPLNFIATIFNTLSLKGSDYITQSIGTFGWLDTHLPTLYIASCLVMLVFAGLISNRKNVAVSSYQKLIIVATLVLNLILIFTTVYLAWTPVGANIIEGVQGRYFIPLIPLLLLLLYNQKIKINMKKASLFLVIYALFSEALTASVLLHRYYL